MHQTESFDLEQKRVPDSTDWQALTDRVADSKSLQELGRWMDAQLDELVDSQPQFITVLATKKSLGR